MSLNIAPESEQNGSASPSDSTEATLYDVVSRVHELRHSFRLRGGDNNRQIDRHAELGTILRMANYSESTPRELIFALCTSKHHSTRNLGIELSNGDMNGAPLKQDAPTTSDVELRIYEQQADTFLNSVCMETEGKDESSRARNQSYELAPENAFAPPLKVVRAPDEDTHAA